ncbi:MAG TPA: hypothetical protein VF015_04950, partial [Acidimicrobiales bacterium]
RTVAWPRPASAADAGVGPADPAGVAAARAGLQRSMTAGAGVLRSAESLDEAARAAAAAARAVGAAPRGPARADACELWNVATAAAGLCATARARAESRGAHARTDFPETSPDHVVRYVLGGPPA